MLLHNLVDTFDEGGRIELRAHNLVGAVGKNGDAPVADKGDKLSGLGSLDLGAHVFSPGYATLTFHIDQDKIVGSSPEHGQPVGVTECGINVKARDAKDLITKRAQHFAAADVQDGVLLLWSCFHLPCRFSLILKATAVPTRMAWNEGMPQTTMLVLSAKYSSILLNLRYLRQLHCVDYATNTLLVCDRRRSERSRPIWARSGILGEMCPMFLRNF